MLKKNMQAFTLFEVLISLAISSFIMLGMMQIYSNVTRFINKTSSSIASDRKVHLLFEVMQKDFSTAFIPRLKKEEESKDKKKPIKTLRKQEKDFDGSFFSGQIYSGETAREIGKNFELFKSVNFITTNALQVFAKKTVRLVRVSYQLEKDKELSKGDKVVYNLSRKETEDLKNSKFERNQSLFDKKNEKIIKTYLVAKGIKSLYVEYILESKKEKKGQEKEPEVEEKSFFVWGDKETKGKIPFKVKIHITFWDEKISSTRSFKCLVPIFTQFIEKEKKDDKKKKEEKSKSDKTSDLTTQTDTSSSSESSSGSDSLSNDSSSIVSESSLNSGGLL